MSPRIEAGDSGKGEVRGQHHPPVKRDRCGTYAGVKQHEQHNEYLCDPCRLARNAYKRRTKKAEGKGAYDRARVNQNIRKRALTYLGRKHPAELLWLTEQIKKGNLP